MRYLLLLLCYWIGSGCANNVPADERPDVLFVYAEGLPGAARTLVLPPVAALAADGVQLSNFYTAHVDPDRTYTQLLTGRRTATTTADTTFVARLRAAGYRTALLAAPNTNGLENPAALGFEAVFENARTAKARAFIEQPSATPYFVWLSIPATAGTTATAAPLGQAVEQLVAALRRNDRLANTLLVITGAAAPTDQRPTGALSEKTLRAPLVLHWPVGLPASRVVTTVAASYDLGPTLLALTDTPAPPPGGDGLSLLPALTGKGKQATHEYLFWQRGSGRDTLRAVRAGDWKYYALPDGRGELYRVTVDPDEADELRALWPRRTKKMRTFLGRQ